MTDDLADSAHEGGLSLGERLKSLIGATLGVGDLLELLLRLDL